VSALLTKRHIHEYGATAEEFAAVAMKNHNHGQYNPNAHFGRDATVKDVLERPVVADLFHLMDCYPFSDGVSARSSSPPTTSRRVREQRRRYHPLLVTRLCTFK
jgi:acetyl-CoA acetyltransferase